MLPDPIRQMSYPEALIYLISKRIANCMSMWQQKMDAPEKDPHGQNVHDLHNEVTRLRRIREELECHLWGDVDG